MSIWSMVYKICDSLFEWLAFPKSHSRTCWILVSLGVSPCYQPLLQHHQKQSHHSNYSSNTPMRGYRQQWPLSKVTILGLEALHQKNSQSLWQICHLWRNVSFVFQLYHCHGDGGHSDVTDDACWSTQAGGGDGCVDCGGVCGVALCIVIGSIWSHDRTIGPILYLAIPVGSELHNLVQIVAHSSENLPRCIKTTAVSYHSLLCRQ